MSERLVWRQAFEGLFEKALGDKVSPALEASLRAEAGVDLSKLEPAYPWATWATSIEVLARALYPSLALEEAQEAIGTSITRGFFQTTIGKALQTLVKLLGPTRTLNRMDRNLRSGNNYSEARLTSLGPTHFELQVNEPLRTQHLMAGIIREGLHVAGARELVLRIKQSEAESVVYEIRWR